MTDQRLAETPPAALVQFLVPTLSPAMGRFNLPVERLGQLAQMLFDVVRIHVLESLRKDFFADLPDPGIPVADHHLTKGLLETPTFHLGPAFCCAVLCENCAKSVRDCCVRGSVLSESRCPRVHVSLWKRRR